MKATFKVSAEDQLLITRCAKKDSGAVEEMVALYGGSLYGLIRSALGQRASLAHPMLTASFAETVRTVSASHLTEPLRVTLTRALLTGLQKKLKQKHAEGPLTGVDRRLSVLFLCLSRLPWEERMLLLLRDQMDYSLEELEAVFSKTEGEIRSQLQKTRLHFREELQKILKDKSALNS